MEKIKRIKNILFNFLLSACLVFTGVAVPQAKAKPKTGQDVNGNTWKYERKTKTLTFSGIRDLEYFEQDGYSPEPEWWCWSEEAKHLVIESGITGLTGEEFSFFRKLKTVELPDTVTRIGNSVFASCWELETVRMPEHLTSIGADAFFNCQMWKNARIPDTVTRIDRGAFSSCYSIREIEIPDKVTEIGNAAFAECINLESVRLPENLKVIEDSIFYGCEKLSGIRLPGSLKKVKEGAFHESGIVHVEIPENVTGFCEGDGLFKNYYGVFEDCKKLKEVVIRSRKLKSCYKKTFKGLDKNTVIKVPKGCLKKYRKLFMKAGLDKQVRVESWDEKEKPLSGTDKNGNAWTYSRETRTLEIFGTAEFGKYSSGEEPGWCIWYSEAEHIIVRDGVRGQLPGGSFRLFYKLRTAELPESVTSVGDYAFYGCKELETITIPKNTAYIGKMAFADCYQLKDAVLPEGITSIGKRAFSGCEELGRMELPDSVEKIGSYAFSECRSLSSVRLPGKLKTVEEGVFFQCRDLAEVNLPASLKKIKKNAFSGSGITRIVVPQNVTGFYKKGDRLEGVFECYPGLKEITIKSKKLEHVYEGAFQGIDKNTEIKVPKSCLKKYKKLFQKAGLDKKIKVKAISGKKKFKTQSGMNYQKLVIIA